MNFIVSHEDSLPQFYQDSQPNCIFVQMANYACHDEKNPNHPLLTTSDEDLELKKLLWTQVF